MINSKLVGLLKKTYHHDNSDYETLYFGEIGRKTDFLTEEQHSLLKEADLAPNNFEKLTHDGLLKGFLKIKGSESISSEFCAKLFIKGLSGDFPRYRQALMSYWYLSELSAHKFKASKLANTCAICGLPETAIMDRTHTLFTYYLGHSWNEIPAHFLADLQEIMAVETPELTDNDVENFTRLLREIEKAELDETPGQLEKRIAKSKLLPKTDKYKRYGILQTLAVVGILPSCSSYDSQSVRSDIVPPLSSWRGELGIDIDKVYEVFRIKI